MGAKRAKSAPQPEPAPTFSSAAASVAALLEHTIPTPAYVRFYGLLPRLGILDRSRSLWCILYARAVDEMRAEAPTSESLESKASKFLISHTFSASAESFVPSYAEAVGWTCGDAAHVWVPVLGTFPTQWQKVLI